VAHVFLLDAGQIAELSESKVGTRATTKEYRIIGVWILRHDALGGDRQEGAATVRNAS